MPFEPDEARIEPLPVDSTGAPLILQCPSTGYEDLDLTVTECAPGVSYVVICGSGHLAFVLKAED
jgi:hypothetical protein